MATALIAAGCSITLLNSLEDISGSMLYSATGIRSVSLQNQVNDIQNNWNNWKDPLKHRGVIFIGLHTRTHTYIYIYIYIYDRNMVLEHMYAVYRYV